MKQNKLLLLIIGILMIIGIILIIELNLVSAVGGNWTGSTTPGLLFWSKIDTNSGTTIFNERLGVGNGNLLGTTGFEWITGKYGNAINSSRENSAGNLSYSNGEYHFSIPTNPKNFTIEAWINTTRDDTVYQQIIDQSGGYEFSIKSRTLYTYDYGGSAYRGGSTSLTLGIWNHVAFVVNINGTGTFYINGNKDADILFSYDPGGSLGQLLFGNNAVGGGQGFYGRIDELKIFNNTRTQEEIKSDMLEDIYSLSINLNSPANNNFTDKYQVTFNCSATAGTGNVINNISLWTNMNGNWVLNDTTSGLTLQTETTTFTKNIPYNPFDWTCSARDNKNLLDFANENRTISMLRFIENSQTFNQSTYETSIERLSINLTYDSSYYTSISGNLIYNGTSYSGTKSGSGNTIIFYKDLGMASPYGNKTFYWAISLTNSSGINYFNSTVQNQNVSQLFFGLCNATLTVPYINFTFKDENTNNYMNASTDLVSFTIGTTATKTYYFTNTTANPSYAFCFSPSDKSINTQIIYQYSNTGYPQRTYYFSGTLTNSTTNKILYLLGSGDGIYSTYIVMTSANSPISGVTIQVERQFSGVWELLTQGITDSAGSITFWLNPNYKHRFTATKTSYGSTQVEVSPSSSVYTIYLSGSNLMNYTMETEGMIWIITPPVGLLNSSIWTFGFNLTASKNNVVNCKMELLDNNSAVLDSAIGCSSSGGYISVNLDMTTHKKIYGRYSIDIGSGYVIIDSDAFWINYPVNKSGATILDWLNDMRNLDLSYFGNDETHREYTLIVLTFLGIMLIASSLSYMGWDWQTGGGIILFVWILILGCSLAGFLTLKGISPYTWLDKYFVAFTFSLFAGGYIFREFV